jgi:predicted RNA-binding Zn ribbon-like protein
METPDYIRQQRVVGGRLALDLLNTQGGPAGGAPEGDVLHDYDDVLAWSQHVGALSASEADGLHDHARRHPIESQAAFERLTATRAYLYALFREIAAGGAPSADLVDRLRDDEAEALRHGWLVAHDGGYRWTWADPAGGFDLQRPVWAAVHSAAALLTEGPLERVKGCASCRFHFLDESRNRSRRWCSMDDCGTRTKSERFVARRAAARSSTRSTGARGEG